MHARLQESDKPLHIASTSDLASICLYHNHRYKDEEWHGFSYRGLGVRGNSKGEASQSCPDHAGVHPGPPCRAPSGGGGAAMLSQDRARRPCPPGELPCVPCGCLPTHPSDRLQTTIHKAHNAME